MFQEEAAAGDLIAFQLYGATYGLALIVRTDAMATYDGYHLAILDVAEQVELDDFDPEGSIARHFEQSGAFDRPTVIDEVAITSHGLDESGVVRLGKREIADDDMVGYEIWLHATSQLMLRQGLLRDDLSTRADRIDDAEEYEEGQEYEVVGDEEIAGDADTGASDAAQGGPAEETSGAAADAEGEGAVAGEQIVSVEVRPWHRGWNDRGLGSLLVEWREELAKGDSADSVLARFIGGLFGAGNEGRIASLVQQLADGDHAAGHALTMFGDAAADALAARLDGADGQFADDILNIMADIGTMRAYEHIAALFASVADRPEHALFGSAVRGYCYAVLLTGGTPAPLRAQLALLDGIDDPDLQDDIASARDAVLNAPEPEQEDTPPPQQTSNDPFGGIR